MKPKTRKYTFRDTDLFYSGYLERLIEEEGLENRLKEFIDNLIEKRHKEDKIHRGLLDIIPYYSKEPNIDLNEVGLDIFIDSILDEFLERKPAYEELVNLNARKYNLRRKAILAAHGDSKDNKWCYDDGTNQFLVQGWIDNMDGEYAALILNCCNPRRHEISSRKSAVLVPNDVYSPAREHEGEVNIELYIPGKGYIDSYGINHEIKELRKSLE